MRRSVLLCSFLLTVNILQAQSVLNSDNAIVELSGEWLLKDYDGYGWYRFKFALDSIPIGKTHLVLGRIDDVDRTRLNGELIGGMGEFPPVSLN